MKSKKVHTDFFRSVERTVGGPPLVAQERAYLEHRYCEEYAMDPGSAEFEAAVNKAANDIESRRKVGTKSRSIPYSGKGAPRKDHRWKLIADLHKAVSPKAPELSIFSVSGSRIRAAFLGGELAPDLKRDVQITFDDRFSLEEVIRLLKHFWPLLRKDKIVRTTHPLEKRKIETLRLVCLEMPNASWDKRLRRWNFKHPKYRYSGTRALITACHDAEKSLTGFREGLAWFYDRMARIPRLKLWALTTSGDPVAKREWTRRRKAYYKMLGELGIGVNFVSARKREVSKKRGQS